MGIGDMRGQGGEAERGQGDRNDMRRGQGKVRGDRAKREGTRDNLAPKRQQGWGQCVVPEMSRHKGRWLCAGTGTQSRILGSIFFKVSASSASISTPCPCWGYCMQCLALHQVQSPARRALNM